MRGGDDDLVLPARGTCALCGTRVEGVVEKGCVSRPDGTTKVFTETPDGSWTVRPDTPIGSIALSRDGVIFWWDGEKMVKYPKEPAPALAFDSGTAPAFPGQITAGTTFIQEDFYKKAPQPLRVVARWVPARGAWSKDLLGYEELEDGSFVKAEWDDGRAGVRRHAAPQPQRIRHYIKIGELAPATEDSLVFPPAPAEEPATHPGDFRVVVDGKEIVLRVGQRYIPPGNSGRVWWYWDGKQVMCGGGPAGTAPAPSAHNAETFAREIAAGHLVPIVDPLHNGVTLSGTTDTIRYCTNSPTL